MYTYILMHIYTHTYTQEKKIDPGNSKTTIGQALTSR